jgi:hypothetical protein
MVKEAYAKTGLKPMRGHYYQFADDGHSCACGIGAIYYNRNVEYAKGMRASKLASAEYGEMYKHGFTAGFDGHSQDAINDTEYKTGYEDGRAVWEAVKP